jgi:enoyl-CoA hydratase
MTNKTVLLEQRNGIARLTLSAPPKNEMGAVFFQELALLSSGLAHLRVRGLIVSGKGRHFSSGANLNELRAMLGGAGSEQGIRSLLSNSAVFSVIESLPFPVVAVIQGCCLGSGLELALACHFRVAAKNAIVGLPEAGFGLMPGCGGTVRLTRLIGRRKATRYILSGESLLAEDAIKAGIVDAVIAKEELEQAALAIIEKFPCPVPT